MQTYQPATDSGTLAEGPRGRDAAAALKFFNGDLSHPLAHGYFGYEKRNVSSLCSKPEPSRASSGGSGQMLQMLGGVLS